MRPTVLAAIGLALLLSACGRPAKVTLYEERHGAARTGGDQRLATTSHTVGRDESIYGISQRYGISTRAIIEANGLRPPYRLEVGRKLVLPRAQVHRVARGDTVYGISRQYGVAMSQIVQLNDLRAPYTIVSGQTLRLPGAVETRVAAAASPAAAPTPSAAPTAGVVREEIVTRQLPPAASETAGTSQTVPPAEASPSPAPAQQARRTPDPVPPTPPVSRQGFVWPVDGKLISGYGAKGKGLHNDGINLAAPRGTVVRAAQSGVVAYAGNELRGFGNLVLIKHSGGVMTAYAHNEAVLVKAGQTITRGEPIAKVGSSGSVDAPQLHFEIRFGRQAVDPMKFLGTRTADAGVSAAAFPADRPDPG